MGLDFNITLHLHYGGKFEEIDGFIQYVGETGCRQIEHDCDKLSLPELGSILREDCRYEGDVREFWWQSSQKSNELRRIIGDKEVVDMISRLGKSKIVHIFTIDQPLNGLVLVTQRFVDRHATMTQPARKQMVARSLFTPRLFLPETIDNEGQNSSLSTPVCGGNGKMACGGGKTLRRRFMAPGVLGRNRTPTSTLTPREMYAAECDEKDYQPRGVTKKAKSATHVTLQPLSKMGEKNTQQPLIAIGSGTGNGKDGGSSNGKDQGFGNDKDKSAAIMDPTVLLSAKNAVSRTQMETAVNNTPNDEGATSSPAMNRKRNPNARPRGMNLVKEVARLKDGEKLEVEFYNNGVVGDNSKAFSRHLGKLVRDRTMCPIRVHSWDEIQPEYLETMWTAVVEKFKGGGIENRKAQVMKHMRKLWRSWRGSMQHNNIRNANSLQAALKKRPRGMLAQDWEWLVTEHYSDPEFWIKSTRNSENRSSLKMPHRSGSKPFRQIIYAELGGKEGKQPTIAEIFKATRKAKTGNLEDQDAEKYEEIISTADQHPEFSQFELIEKCFGPQDHDHVVCFGHGVTPKDVRGPQPSKVDLMTEIQEKNQQINSLTGRVDALESNHQKKIEEMKTAHEAQMAEMKESHQQDMAKIEDAHHKDMATVGDKLELLTKLVLHQRPHGMHLSGKVWDTHNIK